jgi:hypothetical protein
MSERDRGLQGAQTATAGQPTLGELSASKDLHKTKGSDLHAEPANQSDLTNVSLSSANVMRVPHRPEIRRELSTRNSIGTEQEQSTSSQRTRQGGTSSKPVHGVFTNPAYKYSGGLASKIISFFANILKVIERLLLRLLIGPDRSAPAQTQQARSTTPTQTEATSPAASMQEREKQEREKRERARIIARS